MVVLVLVVGFFGCNASLKNDAVTETNLHSNTENGIKYADNMSTFNDIIKSGSPVLVDFYADWCAPCRMMAPILEQVASNLDGVKILKVNVDKNREAAAKYGIKSIPTLILIQNGEVKWQGVGVIQADQIEQIVKSKSTL